MLYLLIGLSFIASLAFSILLRRIDSSTHRLQQVRRTGELQARQLEESAGKYIKEIKDATLEFEVLVHRSKQLQGEIRGEVEAYEQKLKELEEERGIISSISEQIQDIAHNASDVGLQVERMDLGLQRLNHARDELDSISGGIERLESELANKKLAVENQLDQTIGQLITEAEDRTGRLTEQIKSSFYILKEDAQELEKRIESSSEKEKSLSDRLFSLSSYVDERLETEEARLNDRIGQIEQRLQERLQGIESGLSGIKTQAVTALQEEVERAKTQMSDLNLEAISRRDEIINETRRMAERIGDQIEGFQEKYLEVENRLQKQAMQSKNDVEERIRSFEEEWTDLEKRKLSEIHNRIKDLEGGLSEARESKVKELDDQKALLLHSMEDHYASLKHRLENEAVQMEQTVRGVSEEEKKDLISFKEEIDQMKENLHLLTGELKATLRSEMESSVSTIREARISEQEEFHNARLALEKMFTSMQEKTGEVDAVLELIEKEKTGLDSSVDQVRSTIKEATAQSLEELQARAGEFLEDQQDRLESFNKTLDQKISGQIADLVDRGQLQIDELEKRTQNVIRDYVNGMQADLETARNEFQHLRSGIQKEMDETRAMRDRVFTEIDQDRIRLEEFDKKLAMVDRGEKIVEQLDETLEVLSVRLKEAGQEREKLERFMGKMDELRDARKDMESELRVLESQRERLKQAENQLHSLEASLESIDEKFKIIEAGEQIAKGIEGKMEQMGDFRNSFDQYFEELGEKRKFVENAVRYIEKSRHQAKKAVEQASELISKVERAEIRQEDLNKYLLELESKTGQLKKVDSEVQRVEARFEQMDGLLLDLEEKQKQINAMSHRVEEVRSNSDEIRKELESMLFEADEKMDRLTAFYQTIENTIDSGFQPATETATMIAEKTARSTAKGERVSHESSLSDWKKEGILSLHNNHHWDVDLIAERTRIDPAVVRAVINSR